jgi:hypothetical protein
LLLRRLVAQLLHRRLVLGLARSLRLLFLMRLKHLLLLKLLRLTPLHCPCLYLLCLRRLLLLL